MILFILNLTVLAKGEEHEYDLFEDCLTYLDVEVSCERYILEHFQLVNRSKPMENFESILSIDLFLIGESLGSIDEEFESTLVLLIKHWQDGRLNGLISNVIGQFYSVSSYQRVSPGVFCVNVQQGSSLTQISKRTSVEIDLAQASVDSRVVSDELRINFSETFTKGFEFENCLSS